MKKIFITRKLVGKAEKLLIEKGFKVKVYNKDKTIPRRLLIKEIKNVDAIISLLTEKIDKEVIEAMKKCKIVANCAVGYNNIDVEYAKKKNIIVTNTPEILTDATADLTTALILACARRFREAELIMRNKKFKGWKPQLLLGLEMKNKIAGIIGAGRIGFAVGKRLRGFGTKIIYHDRKRNLELERQFQAKRVSLNWLMRNSDFISCHLPLSKETFHILNGKNLHLMKSTAVFVNTSRGEVIDEKVLIKLLKNKKIFAAGFDVYENEPELNPELLKLKNVFLLPHIGSATIETRSAMAELCAKNVINVLTNKKPLTQVNL